MSFRLYAHRGAARERPENTICAFERALELGADALELDVHATRDGTLVVAHDPDGRRMAGVASVIRETSLADVQAWDVGHGFVLDGE
ncbi:MAG TPA: glycerophosphodiester phosphodiesterase family protein, partial [Dehalococcoidia bacterium]|nr:glycerophosphodiester phosphodiesterase family protein [Dehalococcoidia bacterium]